MPESDDSNHGNKQTKEDDLNNLINNLITKRKMPFAFSSVPELIKVFDRICGVHGKSRSEVLNKLIIDYVKEHQEKHGQVELTQYFVKAEPGSQVNIAKKQVIKYNISQRLELKMIKKDLTLIIQKLEAKEGKQDFYIERLKELLPKAIRIYQKTSDRNLEALLQKTEKWIG